MNKNIKLLIILISSIFHKSYAVPMYFCAGASSNYFQHTLNLIGSIHKHHFKDLEEISIYNLGLKNEEIVELYKIKKVKVYNISKDYPNAGKVIREFAWKPVIIKQSLKRFPYVLYTDAGTTILRPIDHLMEYVKNNKYFVCTIGNEQENGQWKHPVGWGTTKFVKDAFKLDDSDKNWILSQEFVMGGVIGVSREGVSEFLEPLLELAKDQRYFHDDGTAPNGKGCGRHDQTLLSIISYSKGLKIFKQDYQQIVPMQLDVRGQKLDLHITWDPQYVCAKTHIYSSRGDIKNLNHFKSFIKYK